MPINVHRQRLQLALLFSGLLWLFLITDFASLADERSLAGFGLLSVLLELAALRMPGWGLVSSAPAVYLAATMHPQVGAAGAAWLALAGITLRGVLRSQQDLRGAATEAVGDLLPILAWLVALDVVSVWPGAWVLVSVLYLILYAVFPQWLTRYPSQLWYRARLRGLPFLAGALILAPPLSRGGDFQPASVLCCIVLSYAIGLASQMEEAEDRKMLSLRLWHQQRQRQALEEELEKIERGDRAQSEVLRATVSAFKEAHTTEEACQALVALAHKLVPCGAVVFFSIEQDGLKARDWHGLQDPRAMLAQAGSGQLFQQAWREARPLAGQDKLVPGQPYAAAVSVPGYGVLYLSREDEFLPNELERLRLMARQAAVSVSKIEERETRERALAFVSEERRLLSRWVFRMNRLLDDSRTLVAAREVSGVLQIAQSSLQALIPHQNFLSYEVLPDNHLLPDQGQNQPSLLALASSLRPGDPPRRYATWPRQWEPLQQPVQSLLAVMLDTEPVRVMLIGDRATGAFSEEQAGLFCLLAQQVEVALNNLRLGREYTEAAKTAAMGQIAAGLSHELNTPLCSIQLALDSALSAIDQNPALAKERLAKAEGSCHTASSILKTLLFYTTSYGIEQGERVDLTELVEEVATRFDCRLKVEERPIRLRGHQLDLEQMLEQLFRNAVSFGAGAFEVELTTADGQVILRVRDQGNGVEPEIEERIFEPFFTTQPPGRGLGLGLPLSRRVAELHGGSLRLIPTAGGACFEARLPLEPTDR